jgi:hypothetical protein
MRQRITFYLTVATIALPFPLAAQNVTAPQPASPPPATTSPPPGTTPGSPPTGPVTPVVTIPPSEAPPAPTPVENTPAPAPAPPPTVTISPDAAYPNGFADPEDPFGNDLSLARESQGSGFNWGLLGLLGLLGLIPLFRRQRRTTRTVYVDSTDPQRVIREEQVED